MSEFFIRRPIFAMVIAILMVILGYIVLRGIPISQYPEITPPMIQVNASYTGANSVNMEQTVATPIEQQVNGVEKMIYQSGRFISRDPIVYPDGANTYAAWYVPAKVDPNGTAKLSTGLKRCYGTLHGYVKLSDGVGYGYYAESHTHGGATFWDDISTAGVVDGVVKNDDAQVYSTATCYNVVLDDTCWDLVCYRRTVEAWVRNQYSLYGGGGGNYNVLLSNCYVFQNMALGLHPFVGPDLSACRKNTWCCLLYGDTTIGLGTASP